VSKRSRDKGNRVERAVVAALVQHGFAAQRVRLPEAARIAAIAGFRVSAQ